MAGQYLRLVPAKWEQCPVHTVETPHLASPWALGSLLVKKQEVLPRAFLPGSGLQERVARLLPHPVPLHRQLALLSPRCPNLQVPWEPALLARQVVELVLEVAPEAQASLWPHPTRKQGRHRVEKPLAPMMDS